MAIVTNPILPGFHPDPCLLRVGEEYFLATSSFEWWPGVPLYRSRDLANWELAGHALTRKSQLDMRGNPDSAGVWAPALSYADGKFWLVYSNVRSFANSKDIENYVITADAIEGPWSDPIALHGRGFDPSLFHDDDGKKWIVSMIWDARPGRYPFAGIEIQEFDPEHGLLGRPRFLFAGSDLRCTEGPHLMKLDGWYYLILAEGGTGYAHAISVARSKDLLGPYELSPNHPLLSTRDHPDHPIQKTGHGSFIQTPDGRWYTSHLCSRPVSPQKRRCILGRETAIQALRLREDGWFELIDGSQLPKVEVEVPGVPASDPFAVFEADFSLRDLHPSFHTLREPPDESWLSLHQHPRALRLKGRMGLQSCFDQSLVARRLHHLACRVETEIHFVPDHIQQSAGLALYYNTQNHIALLIEHDEKLGRVLRIQSRSRGEPPTSPGEPIQLPPEGAVRLRAELRHESLQFSFAADGNTFTPVGPELDATILSDENHVTFGFTGTFAALCAQDATGFGPTADFHSFSYRAL